MKIHIRIWSVLLILTGCLGSTIAQSEIEKKALSLFDTPITWVKVYTGQIEGVHEAQLCLAFDGFNCRGYIEYTSSDTEYLLEGSLQASQLVLLEKYKDTPSGYINGKLENNNIFMEWISMDEQQAFKARFTKVNSAGESIGAIADAQSKDRQTGYISQYVKVHSTLPSYEEPFEFQIDRMVDDWTLDIERNIKRKAKTRFANQAHVWHEMDDDSEKYLSGILYYNSSWGDRIQSKSFTYDKVHHKMIKVAPFLKGSAKWENLIKQKMLTAKEVNNAEGADQKQYANWITSVSFIEPILCDQGIRFYTEKSAVFGQAKILMLWETLAPLVISPSKLNKLKKIN